MKFQISNFNLRLSGAAADGGGRLSVSGGENLVPNGNNLVPNGNNLVPNGNNLVPNGNNLVPETKNHGFRPVFLENSSLISLKTAQCPRRARSAQRTLGLPSAICHLPSAACNRFRSAFSLIEVMVVVSLLSLIVLALMAVFSNTQRAFRAAVTQTDVMEGSRAAMDLMVTDLRGLTPSDGGSNLVLTAGGAVNFFVVGNSSYSTAYQPLVQTLPGSTVSRTNLLNYFFVLGRNNTTWTGTGYIVDNTNSSNLYPLYRFYAETNTGNSPLTLYNLFVSEIQQPQWTTNSNIFSHLLDGVVQLTVRAYDTNGTWINNLYQPYTNAMNTYFYPAIYGEAQFVMFSNAVPASVELEVGVLEDRTLQHAESLPTQPLRNSYLLDKSGNVHLFRQRVTIPNVDPTAYQ